MLKRIKPIYLAAWASAFVFAAYVFAWSELSGDLLLFTRFLLLNKIHFSHEFAFPYFTPGHCGGFLLGGDPQNPIFTIYQLFGLLITNQYVAIKLSTLVAVTAFALGYYRWLGVLGVADRLARALSASVIAVSGYWVAHLKAGHVTFHSIALLPWAFLELEKLLTAGKRLREPRYVLKRLLVLSSLLFILLNAGQIWFQFAFLYFVGRLAAFAFERSRKHALGRAGLIAVSAAGLALALSAVKLGATYLYVLRNFAREMPISQLVSSNRYLFKMVSRAFFDHRIITQALSEPHLGGWWEWSAYVGLASLPVFLLGAYSSRTLWRSRAFRGLLFACVLQLLFCRYGWIVELYRKLIPPAKTMTFYYRGVILLVFLYGALLARGFEWLVRSKRPALRWAAPAAFVLIGLELGLVYSSGGLTKPETGGSPFGRATYANAQAISAWVDQKLVFSPDFNFLDGLSRGEPSLSCYNPPLLGYGGNAYRTQVVPGPVLAEIKPGFLNMNNVPALFAADAAVGYFQRNAWPLWPKSDKDRLREFLTFKQVIPVPGFITVCKFVSLVALLAFFALLGLWWRARPQHRTR